MFCTVIVMIKIINSNSSHGNDYVLGDTTIATTRQQLKHLSITRYSSCRYSSNSSSSVILEEKLFEVIVAPL